MTITAEQAHALKARITPGPWQINPENGVCNQIDGEHHAVCTDQFCYAPESEQTANSRAISAVPDMLATIIADAEEKARMAARITELEARENEWRSAFYVADQFAVAIHDADGKFYSIREQDFHRMSDLYRARTSLAQGE